MATRTLHATRTAPLSFYHLGLFLLVATAAMTVNPRAAATRIADALLPAVESRPASTPIQAAVAAAPEPASQPTEPETTLVASAASGSGGSWAQPSWPASGATSPPKVLNSFGTHAVTATTVTFQQGLSGYAGAVDTYINAAAATTNNATTPTLVVDLAPDKKQGLIRFGNLFASEGGPIPNGATITSATLRLNVATAAGTAQQIGFHRMKAAWSAGDTWNTFGAAPWNATAGIQLDNVEANTTPDTSTTIPDGVNTISVTASLQAWAANPASNFGWVLDETVDDSVTFDSSDGATQGARPLLSVTYDVAAGCLNNGDCPDGNPCTDDVCDLGTGTCSHPNNTASCNDGNLCTTGDLCSGGACSGTAVSCPVGQTCSAGSGLCQTGPTTVSFRQGVNSYTDTVDTYVDAGFTTTSNAATALLTTDGTPPTTDERQTIIRFDNIFGSGAGQIPVGASVTSATLTVNVSNPLTAGDFIGLHRMLRTWSASDTWSTFGSAPWNGTAGIQADGVEAVAAPDLSIDNVPIGSQAFTVTSSVQVWAASPSTNYGWASRIAVADSLVFDSSEATTVASRPLLTVTYIPPGACTSSAECDDSNPCTDDLCDTGTGVCSHPNNTASCDDVDLCTTGDVCSGGECTGAPVSCGVGLSCNPDSGQCVSGEVLVRQPYLQLATPTSMTIVWRSATASASRVHYGTTQGTLGQTATNATVTANHVVTIGGLTPSTRYYYDVGSTTAIQAGGSANHFFETSPPANDTAPFRVWALGDSGDGGANQLAVRNAMLTYTSSNPPDLMLHLGDIAYSSGTDSELTNKHFAVYKDILRNTPSWTTLGNHEGGSTSSGSPGNSTGPYYDAFVMPTNAEAGGVASGTEAYYSFDRGNAHFVVLNSFQVSRAVSGPMAVWLQSDLAATDKQWVIAFWHHPPYSKGTHNSDVETELVDMRQHLLPILEAGGVDLVLTGHSHNYERSYLIDGTYTTPTPSFATLQSQGHIMSSGNGKLTGSGAYVKSSSQNPHEGTVYVVAGHGGADESSAGALNHPVMYFSESNRGSCILDIDATTLTLTNVRSTGVVSDNFTIQKLPSTCAVDGDCNDSNLCTTDTCNVSTGCVYTPVSCPAGQSCNPTSGACEGPTVPPLPIAIGDSWKYFKGTAEPPAAWAGIAFDDSSWLSGPSGFGYGDGDDATVLSDMQNTTLPPGYVSVYTRKAFAVSNPANVSGLDLIVDYDDGFVAYLNGTEVARRNMTAVAYNSVATASHEASAGASGNPAETISLNAYLNQLVTGTNVLSIHGANQDVNSSDFSLIARLVATTPPNPPPTAPSLPDSPANGAAGVSTSPQLCVTPTDANGDPLAVTFKGRQGGGGSGTPFTIIALPDTQFYSQGPPSSGSPATAVAQMEWIRDNRLARNIVAVTELGDCVNNEDQAYQWTNANASHLILENPGTTGLADGIPYGVAVGNHDQFPAGTARTGADENVTTTLYNQAFPKSRFASRAYHGGNYPLPGFADSMDNHYELFSASGMDFIVFHLEWDEGNCSWPADGTAPTGNLNTCQNVLSWVRNLLTTTYSNRRAIITTHFMGSPGSGGAGTMTLSNQGTAVVNMAKGVPNVFLTLGGHLDQANHRTTTANDGHPIYTLVSDFQTLTGGGNGWLRIMTFDPATDTMHMETYSPTVSGGRFINKPTAHADDVKIGGVEENELTLTYDMEAGLPFQTIGSNTGVASGTQTCVSWPGLTTNQLHDWKVDVSDGTSTVTGPVWSFTTLSCTVNGDCNDSNPCTTDTCQAGVCNHAAIAGCCTTAGQCDDSNPCTTDSCNGANTCDHVNNAASCSDGSACTTGDTCSAGVCVGGAAPNCDDSNPCTNDSCVPASGCAHANNTASCNDGTSCTTADVCSGGVCGGTYAPTPGCCTANANCNDGNAGTTDTCTTGNCSNIQVTSCSTNAECNDGDACTTDTCNGANVAALSFDGTDDYVTFGSAAGLGSAQFTLETWFKRTGTGLGNSTGTGGIASLVPLVTKGAPEADGSNVDANYVFGINTAGNVLGADFEDNATGANHPVSGTTAIVNGTWYHAAATYDGSTWCLYLNGNLEATAVVGAFTPRFDSIQHAALGALLTSTGARAGAFQGLLDEPRIWNVARTQAEIQASLNLQLTTGTGLVGRWGLNEGTGTSTADSTTPAENGTLTGGPTWITAAVDLPAIGAESAEYVIEYSIAEAIAGNDSMTPLHKWTIPDAWCSSANSWEGLVFVPDARYTPTYANIPPGYFLGLCQGNNTYTAFTLDLTSAGGSVATPTQVDPDGDSVFQETPPCGLNLASGCGIDYEWSTGRLWWSVGTTVAVTDAQLNCLSTFNVSGVTDAEGLGVGNGYMVLADDQSASAGVVRYPKPAIPFNPPAPTGTPFDYGDADSSAITYSPLHNVWLLIKDNASPKHGYVLSSDLSSALADFDFATQGGSNVDSEGVTLTDPNASSFFVSTEHIESGSCSHAAIAGCCNTAAQCDDGNACTADSCSGNACQHAAIAGCCLVNGDCNDSNICTNDSCNLGSHTCEYANNTAPCNDGNFCTTSDTCGGGSCQPGTAVPECCQADAACNDANTCTTDYCNTTNDAAVSFASPGAVANRINLALGGGSNASPDYVNYFGTSSFTIEGWIYTDGGAAASTGVFRHGRQGDFAQVVVQLGGTNNLQLIGSVEADAVGADQVDVTSPTVLTANTWNHFALVVDRSGGQQLRIHVNGGAATTTAATLWSTSTISSTDQSMIGAARDATGAIVLPFDGRLDEIRIWNSARTQAQIAADMNREIESASGLVHRWSFNAGSGTNAVDSVGGINGTLVGAATWSTTNLPFAGTDSCVHTNLANGASCSDGDACTTSDVCTTGVCAGTAINCDDGNSCTTDSCSGGTCSHATLGDGTACSDGNACTTGDTCASGACVGAAIDCNDGNACTTDSCSGGTCGHVNVTNGTVCNDGNACTTTDVCTGGTCAGTAINCDDGNSCTTDSCSGGTCGHVNLANGTACSDGTACTTGDACSGGTCVGTALNCDDGNVCTNDSCNPVSGCAHANNNATCAGDGNPCTDDLCSAGSCTHPNNNANACTDGNACTGDACVSGSCLSWYAPTASCCGSNANCNDGNAGTTDSCAGAPTGTCSNVVATGCSSAAQCNDANGCTTDACVGAVGGSALNFDGTDDNVTMGTALGLGSATFTLEGWIKKDGASWGAANATTGGQGLSNIVALITKGRSEADGTTQDCNYFLGITAGGRLVADFEQFAASTSPTLPAGQNRPICGTAASAITDNNWHHVAVTYDKAVGKGWRLYKDGVEITAADGTPASCGAESTCTAAANCPQNPLVDPRFDSIQHFALGMALNSTGAFQAGTDGYFGGEMDEARVWNRALTQAEIQAGMNQEITSGTGLLGRWGLNENTGTTAGDSATSPATENGTLRNNTVTPANGPAWTSDSPFPAVLGSCTNTAIPSCSSCTADYQCSDSNACTADSCNTTNDAAISFPSRASTDHMDFAAGAGSNASPDYINWFGTSSFTIEGWMYSDGTSAANSSIFRTGRSGDFPLIGLQLPTGLQFSVSIEASAVGNDQVDLPASTTLTANTWTHFAVVVDRSTNQLRVHLNGGTPATASATVWGTSPIGSADTSILGVARAADGTLNLPYIGRVDELRIWNFARTQAQIQSTMSTELESATGLVHRWSFNAGSGATAVDSIGGITGTLGGVTTWAATPLPFAGADSCVHANLTNGSNCSDNNACTVTDTCQSGSCTSGSPATGGTACGSSSDTACDNPDTCNGSGVCQTNTETNGTACTDFNACTVGDACTSGACVSGSAPNCDDGNPCTNDSCSPATGCVHTNNSNACNDGNACTQSDTCQAGTCIGTSPVVCSASDQCHVAGTCNPGTGVCSNPSATDGTTCDDGNPNTSGDVCTGGVCSGSGLCAGVTCTALDACHVAGVCNPATGLCSNPAAPNGTSCTDGNACTQTDTCQSGTCTGSNPVTCSASDACHVAGTCNPADGLCSNPAAPNGTSCTDGNACTQTDTCQSGTCTGSNPVTCSASDACHVAGTCNPADGLCSNPAAPNGTSCTDGNACTQTDTCQSGTCTGSNPVTCTALDSCHVAGVCNPADGLCSNPAAPNGTSCTDGNACTQTDTCQSGTCTGSNPVTCSASDACHVAGVCNPADGLCSNPAAPNGTTCSDGLLCTTGDACQGGTCVGTAVVCANGDQCNNSGTCNPGTGTCTAATPKPDGTSCTDGNECTTADACSAGSCAGGPAPNCDDGSICTIDTCSPIPGCVHSPIDCSDGDSCTQDTCTDPGGCQHTVTCVDDQSDEAPSGGTVSSDPENDGATPSDQIETAVTTPSSGTVTIHEGSATQPAPSGYDLVNLQVVITAPAATVSSPLVLVFRLDATGVPSGVALADLAVFRNGVAVSACTGTPGQAAPDPCVSSRVVLGDGDVQITVLTSAASTWNLGVPSCNDGNICSNDSGTFGNCTHIASGACGVGGTVYYYRNSASGGSEPSAKPVPSVGVDQTQDAVADVATDGAGAYAVSNLLGSVSLTTVNKYGTPRASDHNGAISSLDASTIARAAVSLITLSQNQRVAGDVTGNNTISALDASQVARFAVGAVGHFDVATASESDWKFLRCDAYAFPGDPGCGAPVYNFTPISQAEAGRNFYAVLYGDVTGNWQPSTGFTAASMVADTSPEEQTAIAADRQLAAQFAQGAPSLQTKRTTGSPAELSLGSPATPLRAGERRELTIDVRNADGILGLDLGLRYDPSRIKIVGVVATGIGTGFSVVNSDLPGVQKIAVFGIVPLSGSGSVLTVTVEALKNTGNQPPLQISGTANEGGIPLRIRQQRIQVPATRQ